MTLLTKPNMQQVWASGGDIVEPSDLKKQQGWTVEVPPHQFENWIQNRQDAYLAHINQRGIPAWDGLTDYLASGLSYVQGTDGKIYKSVAASGPASVVSNPTTDVTDTYWTIAFADVGSFITETEADSRYTQRSNNLSDLTNTTNARTNLGVYSKDEVDTRNLNSTRINVASESTVNLTTAAPNTRHISITGTTTITGFTVATGQCYFVSFSGTLTLTNNANIVTNTGGNIVTAAGDSCIIRATAANTVEVLCGSFLSEAAIGTRGQTVQNVTGLIVNNTNRTNTTGRPIFVVVSGGKSGAGNTQVFVNDILVSEWGSGGESDESGVSFPLPSGSFYRVVNIPAFQFRVVEVRS